MTTTLESVPAAPHRLPLLGHALSLLPRPLGYLPTLRKTGGLVRVDLGSFSLYFLTSPQLVAELLRAPATNFDKGWVFDRIRPLLGNGIVTSSGEFHHRQRRLVQPAFHHARIAGYSDIMARNAQSMADSWRPGQTIAADQAMHSLTLATIMETMFSTRLSAAAVAEVHHSLPIVMKDVITRALIPRSLDWLPLPANRRFDAAATRLRDLIDDVILRDRVDDTDRRDFLSMLLRARFTADDGGPTGTGETTEGLGNEQIRDELVTIMVAGTETSATTLSWVLYELARDSDLERRLHDEFVAVLGGRPCRIEDLRALPFAGRVLNETLRLHAPPLLMRRATTPIDIGGVTIPPGTELAYSPHALNRDPELYPEPLRFDPDRWLPERSAHLPRDAFLPFGAGGHKCLGEAFAWTQLNITLATLVRRWRFRIAPGHRVKEVPAGIVRPNALPMTVTPW